MRCRWNKPGEAPGCLPPPPRTEHCGGRLPSSCVGPVEIGACVLHRKSAAAKGAKLQKTAAKGLRWPNPWTWPSPDGRSRAWTGARERGATSLLQAVNFAWQTPSYPPPPVAMRSGGALGTGKLAMNLRIECFSSLCFACPAHTLEPNPNPSRVRFKVARSPRSSPLFDHCRTLYRPPCGSTTLTSRTLHRP